jgi:hypothetical protein
MSDFGTGPVLAATVTVADLDAAIARYTKIVGYVRDAAGTVSPAQAASWGAPGMAGRAWQLMRPESGEPGWIRLVEGTRPTAYRPLAHYGWAAIEILLRNTDDMHARMKDTEFTIIGEPHPLKSSPDIKAMQVVGPDGEALYLTNVPKGASPIHELPQPQSDIDRIFIMVLGVPDFAATHADFEARFGLPKTSERTRGMNFLGAGYGLEDAGQPLPMSTVQLDGRSVIQVDGMQPTATSRPCADGALPPGIAIVSLARKEIDTLAADALGPVYDGDASWPYQGGRAVTVRGAGGELYEMVAPSG